MLAPVPQPPTPRQWTSWHNLAHTTDSLTPTRHVSRGCSNRSRKLQGYFYDLVTPCRTFQGFPQLGDYLRPPHLCTFPTDKLPPHRPYNHHIKLTGPAPIPGPSKQESSELQDCIAENVAKGFLQPSKSNRGSPFLLVPKKDGSLQLCVNYRKLNNVTRKNAYPVPPMLYLLTLFHGATLLLKLDLRGAYNLGQIAEGNECAFLDSSSFQHFVNDVLADLVKVYVMVYLDDILCKFHNSSLQFLGVIVASNIISMDPAKCQKLLDWPQPTSVKTLQGFLAFNTAPILTHFSELAQTFIKTDASDYAVAGVISHYIILNSTTRFMTRNFWQLFFAYRIGFHTFS
ncbi:retrotransposon nucleocapsid protein, partial [Puccinia sorghi]